MELCDTPSDFCDEHYSFECECPIPVAQVRQVPASVWVVVELYSKAVRITPNVAATGQVSGKAAIFQKPEITQQLAGRIVGVFLDEKTARESFTLVEGAEYIVERHPVGSSPAPLAAAPVLEQSCARCYGPAVSTFCDACQMERNRQMRERDGDIIADQQPLIKSDFAFRDPLPTHA